jgi:hypothetical protein
MAGRHSDANGSVDLLTAVTHELGHTMGIDSGAIMREALRPGVRVLPASPGLPGSAPSSPQRGIGALINLAARAGAGAGFGTFARETAEDWRLDFLNNLGQARKPDAAQSLRIRMPG